MSTTTAEQAWAQRVQELRRTVRDRRRELQHARHEVTQIESGWHSGDDSATAEDWSLANAEVTRLSALLEASQHQLQATARRRPVSTKLAERVADLLQPLIDPDLPVQVFAKTSKTSTDQHASLQVVATSFTDEGGAGIIAGDVKLVLTSVSKMLSLPSGQQVRDAFPAGWIFRASAADQRAVGDRWETVVNLSIERAWLAVPEVVPNRRPGRPKYQVNDARGVRGALDLAEQAVLDFLALGSKSGLSSDPTERSSTAIEKAPKPAQDGSVAQQIVLWCRPALTAKPGYASDGTSLPTSQLSGQDLAPQVAAGLVGMVVPLVGLVTEATYSDTDAKHGYSITVTVVRREVSPDGIQELLDAVEEDVAEATQPRAGIRLDEAEQPDPSPDAAEGIARKVAQKRTTKPDVHVAG